MVAGPVPGSMRGLISALERRDRDAPTVVTVPPPQRILDSVSFVRVRGLSAFWRSAEESALLPRLEDLFASLYGLGLPLHFLLIGRGGANLALYGLEAPRADALLRPLLTSILSGALLDEEQISKVYSLLQQAGILANRAILTGIPTRRSDQHGRPAMRPDTAQDTGASDIRPDQIERVIRGMRGESWAWWTRAIPVPYADVAAEVTSLLATMTTVSAQIKRQIQDVTMRQKAVTNSESEGQTRTISDEMVDVEAEFARSLLERQRDRYNQAKAVGLWQVECHALAADQGALGRLAALLRAAFSGVDSTPEAIRTHAASESAGATHAPSSRLTTGELTTLAQLPQYEVEGFRVAPFARFDQDPLEPLSGESIVLGRILDGEHEGPPLSLPASDLSMHTLVAGMTGSGKTTTIFNLLLQLRALPKPKSFLVIEPAKAEYRHMLNAAGGRKPSGPLADLRVYTLADETVAPFRLNPFEFEIMDAEHRVHVQTHIDYLKAVFNAAFVLYAPMPYVLDMCLHEIYTDCGWDLATGLNTRLTLAEHTLCGQLPVFPTLSDLYEKIDEVVDQLGYEDRIEMDVKAGLRARIGSLMLGNKGLMLNCRHGIPTLELLKYPTVLELERIGNDDEKSFLIGMVLTRLYEFRRMQASAGQHLDFRHLAVIEEAHRLLKNVSTEQHVEGANQRGQAVETFANMLSEIRSYGQGILIAEQIPTKLAPDALKNTNLKIVHRLVAADEREALAGTMNMSKDQSAFLSTLRSGRCAMFAEPADHPYLAHVEDVRQLHFPHPTLDDGVRAAMKAHTRSAPFEPAAGYWAHVRGGRREVNAHLFALAGRAIATPPFRLAWTALMIVILHEPALLTGQAVAELRRLAQADGGSMSSEAVDELLRTAVVLAVEREMNQRGRLYRLGYKVQMQLGNRLLEGVMHVLRGEVTAGRAALTAFANDYATVTRLPEGPYAGCNACAARCRWRPAGHHLSNLSGLRQETVRVLEAARGGKAGQETVAALCRSALQQAVGELPATAESALCVCLAAHLLAQPSLSRSLQLETAQTVQLLVGGSS